MTKRMLLMIVFVSCWYRINTDCSYLDTRSGMGYPTDTCFYHTNSGSVNNSMLLHCTSSGIEVQEYNNYNCDGSPSKTLPANTFTEFTEWDYNCGSTASSNECNTATITSCDDTSYSEITMIINQCFNTQNSSYSVQCDGGGYNGGYILRYNELNCIGNGLHDDDIFGIKTTSNIKDCEPYWQCDDNSAGTNDGDSNSGNGNIAESIENIQWNPQMIALVIAGILICLLITIICVYCSCCRSKAVKSKPKPLVNNDYVAMQPMVDNQVIYAAPLISKQPQHQNNPSNISTLSTPSQYTENKEYDIMPSAPKMSSINEQYEQLPNGWSKAVTNDGKVYYQNDITKETQWEKPSISQTEGSGPNYNRMQTNGAEGGGIINLLNDEKYKEVVGFFNENISIFDSEDNNKYIKLFVLNGYDTLYKISQLSEGELIEIGIQNIQHREKILLEASKI